MSRKLCSVSPEHSRDLLVCFGVASFVSSATRRIVLDTFVGGLMWCTGALQASGWDSSVTMFLVRALQSASFFSSWWPGGGASCHC